MIIPYNGTSYRNCNMIFRPYPATLENGISIFIFHIIDHLRGKTAAFLLCRRVEEDKLSVHPQAHT